MSNDINSPDGKFVVVENGQRVSSPKDTREEAETIAAQRSKLAEARGTTVPENRRPQVKQNICG